MSKANATCNQCGYRGLREGSLIWCPACWDDENGELILDQKPAEPPSPPWDAIDGCFGHCDPEGWHRPCQDHNEQEPR